MTTPNNTNSLPISENLCYWLQIVNGLTTDDILYLAKEMPGRVGIIEEAVTAIACVLDGRCPKPGQLN